MAASAVGSSCAARKRETIETTSAAESPGTTAVSDASAIG